MKRFLPLLLAAPISVAAQQMTQFTTRTVADLGDQAVEDPVSVSGSRFVYFVSDSGVSAFDRATRRQHQILVGNAFGLAIHPRGSTIAFARVSEDGDHVHIWSVEIDPATGKARGPARRVSVSEGDTPAYSADGASLAFAADSSGWQRLVVIPSRGGAERTLAKERSGIEPITWSPDGRWIHYGVNTRAELLAKSMRVPADGSRPAEQLALGFIPFPGLSPDGRRIAMRTAYDTLSVFDANGKKLFERYLDPLVVPYSWSSASRLVAQTATDQRDLFRFDVGSGRVSALPAPATRVWGPTWSPDGKRIALIHWVKNRTYLALLSSQGRVQKLIPLALRHGNGVLWSPDSRYVAYIGQQVTSGIPGRPIRVVDVSTGRDRQIGSTTDGRLIWAGDSQSMLYTVRVDSIGDGDAAIGMELRRSTIEGQTRTMLARRAGCACLGVVSDSVAIFRANSGATRELIDLRTGVASQIPNSAGNVAGMTMSGDGRWLAGQSIRTATAGPPGVLLIMSLHDATANKVDLPFRPLIGLTNSVHLPSGDILLMGATASPDTVALFKVNPSTKAVTELHRTRRFDRGQADLSLSPDGATLLFLSDRVTRSKLLEIDLPVVTPRPN